MAIVAVRNGATWLAHALASIHDQAGVAIDLVVVDGGSTDDSREIARSFGARVLAEEGRGLANAWNTGIARSSAPYIAFLDSDDVWIRDTLAARISALEVAPGAGISVGRVIHRLEHDASGAFRPKLNILLTECLAPIPGTMVIRREIFHRIGVFDAAYRIAADTEWIGRARNAGIGFVGVDRLVLVKRLHASNLTTEVDLQHREMLSALRSKIAAARRERNDLQ